MQTEKEIAVDYEEIAMEVGGLVGAIDGKIVERVRRLIMYLRVNQWAVGELSVLANSHNFNRKRQVLKQLEESLRKADALLEGELK